MHDQTSHRRRWYQYSLRSLFVLVTLACVLLTAWKMAIAPYAAQGRAVERLRGKVKVLQFGCGEERNIIAEPALPVWLWWTPNSESLVRITTLRIGRYDVNDAVVNDEDFEDIGDFSDLEVLDLSGTKITDKTLEKMSSLRKLRRLSLAGTSVTDAGLEELVKLPNLESLNIADTQATEAILSHLKKLPKLVGLGHNLALSDKGLALLSEFPQLRNQGAAHLRGVTDEGLTRIDVIGKPQWLRIEDARIVHGWNRLNHIPTVESLDLVNTRVNGEGMAAIARLPKLHTLHLDGEEVTGNWEPWGQMFELKFLDSRDTVWPAKGLSVLSQLYWVQGRLSQSGATLEMLGKACGPRTQELFIFPGEVGLNFVECGQYPQYMSMMIQCRVHGPDLAALVDFEQLTLLEIDDEALAAASAPFIEKLPNLKELRLCCPMTYAADRSRNRNYHDAPGDPIKPGVLFKVLRNAKTLQQLKGLAINVTSDDQLAFLENLPQLELLRLYRNDRVTDAGLVHVARLSNLKTLCLTGTKITDAGLEQLKGLTKLQSLDIDHTGITDAGLKHLKGLSQLEWLELHETQVTTVGVAELQRALPNCRMIGR